ncbi:MAG: ATP-grasp domain-containing protein [Candidatus Bathyarchaeota archaeon]|nr:MAG: ATP-grasp domain-containing protein [Candidatus Bathyarchaeota archaeon]
MRVLIYEHLSGGGFADEPMPLGILSEGFSMLRTLISDFKASGHNVTTLLDSRIARLNPPIDADFLVPIFSSREAQAIIRKVSESVDAAYIVAPETDQVLQSLVEFVEQAGATSLNCPANAIAKVSNKAVFYTILKKLGISTPETIMFSVHDAVAEIKQTIRDKLNFPLVFKPSDGVSCCGLSVVTKEDQVDSAVNKIKGKASSKLFLAQELIKGAAASVSLISTGNEAMAISLNQQDVAIGTPEVLSTYKGGVVPFIFPLKSDAFAVAEKIVKSFRDLKGYIGVDLILTEEEAVAIEVNPRLTTSYIGLRRVVNFNPADAIVNAILKRELPTNIRCCGYAYFSKVETTRPTTDALKKTYEINEVVSPPFPVSSSGNAFALVSAYGATLGIATAKFREAKKRVLSITSQR